MSLSLACVGDVVVDVFLQRLKAYPGGNAYNVACYWRLLLGGPASFRGIVGADRFGDHLITTLDELGVERSRVRVATGPSGQALVSVGHDGDRHFVASNQGGVQRDLTLRLSADELDELAQYDLIHTSTFAGIDHLVRQLGECAPVSYDFSNAPDPLRVAPVASHLEVAFFSAAALSQQERDEYARAVLRAGCRVVVMTAGSAGSVGYVERERVIQGIESTEVVDALGAGDAYIAGFLRDWYETGDLEVAMRSGARRGAEACCFEGAFGRPLDVGEEVVQGLKSMRRHSWS